MYPYRLGPCKVVTQVNRFNITREQVKYGNYTTFYVNHTKLCKQQFKILTVLFFTFLLDMIIETL